MIGILLVLLSLDEDELDGGKLAGGETDGGELEEFCFTSNSKVD